MKRTITALFTGLMLVAAAAQEAQSAVSSWPMGGGNVYQTYSTTVVGPDVPVFKWKATGLAIGGEPSIGEDGTIYLPSSGVNGSLSAVSPQGIKLWQIDDPLAVTPAIGSDGRLYGVHHLFTTACFATTGEILWEHYWGKSQICPMIASDGNVWTSCAKMSPSGEVVSPTYWSYSISEARNGGDTYHTFGNSGSGTLKAQYLTTTPQGVTVWNTRWSTGLLYHYTSAKVAPDGDVIISDALSSDGESARIRAFYPDDGTLHWSIGGFDSVPRVAIAEDGTIYASVSDELFALNADGTTRWTREIPSGNLSVDGAGTVYLNSTGKVLAFSPDGDLKWTISLQGTDSPVYAPVLGNDGTLYITASGGKLYAYSPEPATLSLLALGGLLLLRRRKT